MPDKREIRVIEGSFIGLSVEKEKQAILEFDLMDEGRVAIVLDHDGLHSLYRHILSEGSAGRLAFALRSESESR